jgi:hypothetical protein
MQDDRASCLWQMADATHSVRVERIGGETVGIHCRVSRIICHVLMHLVLHSSSYWLGVSLTLSVTTLLPALPAGLSGAQVSS